MRASLSIAVAAIAALAVAAPVAQNGDWTDGNGTDGYTTSSGSGYQSSQSSSGGTNYGTATNYFQDGEAGACGNYNSDSSLVVALDTAAYGSGGSCGQPILLCNQNSGACTTATVADECPSCGGYSNIDLSQGAWNAIADGADGVFPIAWTIQ